MHGVLRVVMEPLLGDMPLVGALSVFFLKKPVSPAADDMLPVNRIKAFYWNGGGSHNDVAV